jgi:tRNA pseudouridine55 synthase
MQSPETRTPNPELSGVFIVDKPAGWTSHDVVAALRRLLGIRQIGHFGTLDPFATGVLPLSVGKATRFAQFYLKSRKAYQGTMRFGYATDTYDATGQPASERATPHLDAVVLEGVFRDFTGRLMQTPPPFSAKRVSGVRAYELARQRKPVTLMPAQVEVYALELLSVQADWVSFAVECSGGTYVRSLAHDIGQRLGCPAHLASLRRTAVAEFSEKRALTLEKLEEALQRGELETWRVPLEALLPECLELVVRGREEISVRHGHAFELAQALRPDRGDKASRAPVISVLKILNAERRLIAVARHVAGSVYHPDLVLA